MCLHASCDSTHSHAQRIQEPLTVKGAGAQELLGLLGAAESASTPVGLESTLQGAHLTAPEAAEHAGTQTHGSQGDASWKKEGSSAGNFLPSLIRRLKKKSVIFKVESKPLLLMDR